MSRVRILSIILCIMILLPLSIIDSAMTGRQALAVQNDTSQLNVRVFASDGKTDISNVTSDVYVTVSDAGGYLLTETSFSTFPPKSARVGYIRVNNPSSGLYLHKANETSSIGLMPDFVLDPVHNELTLQDIYLDNDIVENGPIIIIDDDQSSYWTLNAYSAVASNDSDVVAEGADSLKVVTNSSDFNIYHDYKTPQNFSDVEFWTIWVYGNNTNNNLALSFWNENFFSRNNGYMITFADDFSGWKRLVFPRNAFGAIENPSGWDSIKCISIGTSTYMNATFRFDRFGYDTGVWGSFEVQVPDSLATSGMKWAAYSWIGSTYGAGFNSVSFVNDTGVNTNALTFLDGTVQSQILAVDKGVAYYAQGNRNSTQTPSGDTDAGNITYSNILPRANSSIGFAIKMPLDDGRDSPKSGISQVRIRIIIYYADPGWSSIDFEDESARSIPVQIHNGISSANFTKIDQDSVDISAKITDTLNIGGDTKVNGTDTVSVQMTKLKTITIVLSGHRFVQPQEKAGVEPGGEKEPTGNESQVESPRDENVPVKPLGPLLVDDDQSSFWSVQGRGEGSLGVPIISDDFGNFKSGSSSLKITVPEGGFGVVEIYHIFSPPLDWSNVQAITLWWYGQNTKKSIVVTAYTEYGGHYYNLAITDDFKGWMLKEIPLREILPVGSPDWKRITRLHIQMFYPSTWYLDTVELSNIVKKTQYLSLHPADFQANIGETLTISYQVRWIDGPEATIMDVEVLGNHSKWFQITNNKSSVEMLLNVPEGVKPQILSVPVVFTAARNGNVSIVQQEISVALVKPVSIESESKAGFSLTDFIYRPLLFILVILVGGVLFLRRRAALKSSRLSSS